MDHRKANVFPEYFAFHTKVNELLTVKTEHVVQLTGENNAIADAFSAGCTVKEAAIKVLELRRSIAEQRMKTITEDLKRLGPSLLPRLT